MTDAEHARYLKLIEKFHAGSYLSSEEYAELTRLHVLNATRVGMITTGTKEASS